MLPNQAARRSTAPVIGALQSRKLLEIEPTRPFFYKLVVDNFAYVKPIRFTNLLLLSELDVRKEARVDSGYDCLALRGTAPENMCRLDLVDVRALSSPRQLPRPIMCPSTTDYSSLSSRLLQAIIKRLGDSL